MPPKKSTKKTVTKKQVIKISSMAPDAKEALLKSQGASADEIKMILEIDIQNKNLAAKNPGLAAAWGAGCGGVNC